MTVAKTEAGFNQTGKRSNIQQIKKKMDDARLRADYENLRNLMNRIPPEILELEKRRQLNRSNRER